MSVSLIGTVEEASKRMDVYWEELSTCPTSYETFMNPDGDSYKEKFAVQRDIRLSIDKSVSLGRKSNHFIFCTLADMPSDLANLISHTALADEEDINGVFIYASETNIYSKELFDSPECVILAVQYKKQKRVEVLTEKELGQPEGEPSIEYVPDVDENGIQKTSMEYLYLIPLTMIGAYESASHFLSEFNRARTSLYVAKLREEETPSTLDAEEESEQEARLKALKKRNNSVKQNITDSRERDEEVDFMSDPEY